MLNTLQSDVLTQCIIYVTLGIATQLCSFCCVSAHIIYYKFVRNIIKMYPLNF